MIIAIWIQRASSDSKGRKLLIEIAGPTNQTSRASASSPIASSTQRLKISLKTAPIAFIASGATRPASGPTWHRPGRAA